MGITMVVSCLIVGLAGMAVTPALVRSRTGLRLAAPASSTDRWLPGLGGWRHHRDGLQKHYLCDSTTHAHLFVGRLASAIRSPDELTRLRATVHGAAVVVRIHTLVPDGQPCLTRADVRLARRIDRLDKAFHCPMVEPLAKLLPPPPPRPRR